MKNILKYGFMGLSVMAMTSCIDTLDTKPKVIFDAEQVWGSKATVEGFVYATYSSMLGDMGYLNSVQWENRTPNGALCTDWSDGFGNYDGVANETSITQTSNFGPSRFTLLRKANMILENVEASSTLSEAEKKQLKGHGHLIRGMIFFDQARKMGRFVPVTQVFDESDSISCKIPLTKDLAESYNYVINDLKYAAENLAETEPTGVPTKWAAKVILSRAALQAYAYTGNKDYIDLALNAAKDVTEAKSLSNSDGMFNNSASTDPEILWGFYRDEQNTGFSTYVETIRTCPNIKAENINNAGGTPFTNAGRFEAWGLMWPTQDLVDQFLVNDEETGEALPWNETSQWKKNVTTLDPATIVSKGQIDNYEYNGGGSRNMPCESDFTNTNSNYPTFKYYATLKEGATNNISQLMYSNRDKRFYTTVVYDGCNWLNESIELHFRGNASRDIKGNEQGGWYLTTTNYYWRKNTVEEVPRGHADERINIHFNLARVGEAYMNLAEAYLLKEDVTNAVIALNATRTTHGDIAPSKAATLEDAWKDYIRERNCELVNEGGDLYWSYLRWGKYGGYANHGEDPGAIVKDLNRPVYMIQIDSKRETVLVNQLTFQSAAGRKFSERRYLLPISQDFLNTREAYGIQDNYTQEW